MHLYANATFGFRFFHYSFPRLNSGAQVRQKYYTKCDRWGEPMSFLLNLIDTNKVTKYN